MRRKPIAFTSILLIAAGAAVMILPKMLSVLITAVGIIVILFSIFTIVTSSENPIKTGQGISGIIIGAVIIILPHLIRFGVPLLLGLFLVSTGIKFTFAALSSTKNMIVQAIVGIVIIASGITIIIHPFEFNDLVLRIIAGIFIFCGIIRIIPGFVIKPEENPPSEITIDDFDVKD